MKLQSKQTSNPIQLFACRYGLIWRVISLHQFKHITFSDYFLQDLALEEMRSKVGTISDRDGVTQLIVTTLNESHTMLGWVTNELIQS